MNIPFGIVGLSGLPGSGVELISQVILAHSRVDNFSRLSNNANLYEISLKHILSQCQKEDTADHAFLVEATKGAAKDTLLLLKVLKDARELGIYTGLIIVLMSPFDAFLFQAECQDKQMIGLSDEGLPSFPKFARTYLNSLRKIAVEGRTQHFRVTSNESLLVDPVAELSRLLALIPLRIESEQVTQLEISCENEGHKPSPIMDASRRPREIEELIKSIHSSPLRHALEELHDLCGRYSSSMSDEDVFSKIITLATRGLS